MLHCTNYCISPGELMITPNEHLTALNQASVKTAVGLANTALNGAENLVNTQIKITKT